MDDIEITNRKSAMASTAPYCHLANNEDDYIECSKWSNGDGIDINVCNTVMGSNIISVTWGEFKLIKKLIKKLKNE